MSISCSPSRPVPQSPKPCVIPAFPEAPDIVLSADCPDTAVCLTLESAVSLGNWARAVVRWHEAVASCPGVQEEAVQGLVAAPPPYEPSLEDVERWMTLPGVKVKVEQKDCGEVNAYYYYLERRIVMCNELKAFSPGLSRFILAHEMAHAIIWQRGIPYTGSGEVAADELAAWILSIRGDQAAVIAAAEFFAEDPDEEDPWDDHPSDARRAATLVCLAVQSQGKDPAICTTDFFHVGSTWNRLLSL